MKLNKILSIGAIFALALGLASCDKNKEQPINATEGTGEKAWTAFTIQLPNSSALKAVDTVGHGDEYDGTTDEQKVSKVRVVFYNDAGVVAYAKDIIAANNDGKDPFDGADVSKNNNAPRSVSEFTTVAMELKKAVYDVYVFLNAPKAVLDVTVEGKRLDDLKKAGIYNEDHVMDNTKGFFMSNAKGPVTTTGANWQNTKEDAEDKANSVKVPVERAVAKVFVNDAEIKSVGSLTQPATATVKRFAVDVTNKHLFWVRQMDGTSTTVDKATGKSTGTEDADTPRIESYAKDPNMGDNYATATAKDLEDQFNYRPDGSVFDAIGTGTKAPGYKDENGIYVAENTMDADQQYEVATTRVIFEVEYIPSVVKELLDKSFVDYKGMLFGLENFKTKVEQASTDDDATDALLSMPQGFVKEIKELTEPLEFTKSFVKGNIKFYLNGINYYTTTIRHFTDTQVSWASGQKLQYGRYGVVRNNIYKLTVDKIAGPGKPVIEEPDPEIPDDKEKDYIAVRVDVQPWLVREQSVEL